MSLCEAEENSDGGRGKKKKTCHGLWPSWNFFPKSPFWLDLKHKSLPHPSIPWSAPSQTTSSAQVSPSPPKVSHTAAQLSFPWQPPLRTTQNKFNSGRNKDIQTTVRSKRPALSKHVSISKPKLLSLMLLSDENQGLWERWQSAGSCHMNRLMLKSRWAKNIGVTEWSDKSMWGSLKGEMKATDQRAGLMPVCCIRGTLDGKNLKHQSVFDFWIFYHTNCQ